jgi:type II secretory pathway component PulM
VRLRELWTWLVRWYAAHSMRDRRILAGIGAAAALSLLYVGGVQPLIHYRQRVKTEIEEGQDQLEHAARFLAVADALHAERDDLRQRVAKAKERLLPGSSGTLGAAALQERANSVAAQKGITVQSTQVMKEEPVEPFHKIAIRLTLSGELKPFAELVSDLEYGPQQLSIPFVELSRRGAIAGAKGPRTLQATVEVSGYLQGEQAAKAEPEPAEGEGEAPAGTAEGEAPAGTAEGEAPAGAPAGGTPPEISPGAPAEMSPGAALETSPGAPPASPVFSAEAPAPPTTTPAPPTTTSAPPPATPTPPTTMPAAPASPPRTNNG